VKRYSKLSYDELRAACLNGELEHKYAAEENYEFLLDYECRLDIPNEKVMAFCNEGLRKLGKHDKYKWLFDLAVRESVKVNELSDVPTEDYHKLPYEELRGILLKNELHHENMNKALYERLLNSEIECGNEGHDDLENHTAVIKFCIAGLRKSEDYKDFTEDEIFFKVLDEHTRISKAEREVLTAFYSRKPKFTIYTPISVIRVLFTNPKLVFGAIAEGVGIFYRKRKRLAVGGIAVVSLTLALTITVVAFGDNITEFLRSALNIEQRTPTDINGDEVVLTDNIRTYNSMSSMLETENLNILYPTMLPDNYEFTNFEVTNFGADFEVRASAVEPHILYIVRIGADNQISHYDYEINGIKFYIVELDERLYQAGWNHNGDYYTAVVGNRAALLEIVENLRGS
jgi:hypothetical protein